MGIYICTAFTVQYSGNTVILNGTTLALATIHKFHLLDKVTVKSYHHYKLLSSTWKQKCEKQVCLKDVDNIGII